MRISGEPTLERSTRPSAQSDESTPHIRCNIGPEACESPEQRPDNALEPTKADIGDEKAVKGLA